jgi:hypothetical protein
MRVSATGPTVRLRFEHLPGAGARNCRRCITQMSERFSKQRAAIVVAIEALPSDELLALLVEINSNEAIVGLPKASHAEAIHHAFWTRAMVDYDLGKPERLARMLEMCAPLIGIVGSRLAGIVTKTAKQGRRGRPSKKDDYEKVPGILRRQIEAYRFRSDFARAVERWGTVPRDQRSGTPTDNALQEMSIAHNMSVATVKRHIYTKARIRKRR